MLTAMRKIHKDKGAAPDALEEAVAKAFFDIETNNVDLQPELRPLYITGARLVDVKENKKAIVISVPVPLLKQFQSRLIPELEKKFSGQSVVIIAHRRILPASGRRSTKQMRPRSRTLTAVHSAMLDDVVFPTEIVGKRTKMAVDQTTTLKCFLDKKDQANVEMKLDVFASVYKTLTGKHVVFEFPVAK